jgi:hypothetical protein
MYYVWVCVGCVQSPQKGKNVLDHCKVIGERGTWWVPASDIMYAYYRGYANRKDEIGHSGFYKGSYTSAQDDNDVAA